MITGYLVDGYDREKNAVFEYDEPKHNTLSIKKKDIIRQTQIIKFLNPSNFFRYDEKSKVLYDVISGKEII